MNDYKYILEPYDGMKTRYDCPGCGKKKTFSRYINIETNEHLADHVGRCNREQECAYHYKPKQYFEDNNFDRPKTEPRRTFNKPKPQTSYIPTGIFNQSLSKYENNNFVLYLRSIYGQDVTSDLMDKYFIGTSKKWPGATVFWQKDITGRIRTGKIMLYDKGTGKRVKVNDDGQSKSLITWVHSELRIKDFNLKQCFFGEHLVKDKPIAIAESEKTAILCSVILPEYNWLASGGLSNLSIEKFKPLKGKEVMFFADAGCYDKWSQKAKELSKITDIIVSDILEETEHGTDLADHLIITDPVWNWALTDEGYPAFWDYGLPEIPSFENEPALSMNVLRHGIVLNAGLLKYPGTTYKLTASEGNDTMTTQTAQDFAGNFDNQLLAENQDIVWSYAERSETVPLFSGFILTCRIPMSFSEFSKLKNEIDRDENGRLNKHKAIQVTARGVTKRGWIIELDYDQSDEPVAIVKLRESNNEIFGLTPELNTKMAFEDGTFILLGNNRFLNK